MKKIALLSLAMIMIGTLLVSCTNQQMAKEYGGTATIALPPGKKLITATWKDTHLWYLLRDIKPGETPETYEFKESSNFGIMQGTVIFKEQK